MPKQQRNNTRYSGVYFVLLANGDQTFFIRYKKDRILHSDTLHNLPHILVKQTSTNNDNSVDIW